MQKTNYSQREVAELIGVDKNTYSKWENNESAVKSDYLPLLAEMFKVEIGEFFSKTDDIVSIHNNSYEGKDQSVLTGAVIILNSEESVRKFIEFINQEKKKE